MKLYIAGPMSGFYNFNSSSFNRAAKDIASKGHEPVLPWESNSGDGSSLGGGGEWTRSPKERAWFLRKDFALLLECDGIALLDGWEESVGANLELLVAVASDLERFRFYDKSGLLRPTSEMPRVYHVQTHLHEVAGSGLIRL